VNSLSPLSRYIVGIVRSLGNSTNLTVENGRDKCVRCAWEVAEEDGLARGFFPSYISQSVCVDRGSGGSDGSFVRHRINRPSALPCFL